jgi:pimeloyl-ACP methyl ester carboxylesterase
LKVTLLFLALVIAAPALALDAKAPTLGETCLTKSERARAVAFRSSDGISLEGVLLGTGKTGIALGHEYRADLCSWLPFARVVAGAGYRVLDVDLRGWGSSGTRPQADLSHVDRDLLAAAQLLRARGATRIVLMGASMGGTGALVAGAALRPAPVAVVSLSGPAEFSSLEGRPAVRRLHAPTLFVAGKYDPGFVDDARSLFAASASPAKKLDVEDTGAHGTDLIDAHVRSMLLSFLRAHARRSH